MSPFRQHVLARLCIVSPDQLRERVAKMLEDLHESNLQWPERLKHPELACNATLRLLVKSAAVEDRESEAALLGYLLEGREIV